MIQTAGHPKVALKYIVYFNYLQRLFPNYKIFHPPLNTLKISLLEITLVAEIQKYQK